MSKIIKIEKIETKEERKDWKSNATKWIHRHKKAVIGCGIAAATIVVSTVANGLLKNYHRPAARYVDFEQKSDDGVEFMYFDNGFATLKPGTGVDDWTEDTAIDLSETDY